MDEAEMGAGNSLLGVEPLVPVREGWFETGSYAVGGWVPFGEGKVLRELCERMFGGWGNPKSVDDPEEGPGAGQGPLLLGAESSVLMREGLDKMPSTTLACLLPGEVKD